MTPMLLLTLPLVVPFTTAILAFLFRRNREGRWISVAGSASVRASTTSSKARVNTR